jgi:hypothetical protein
MIIAGSKSGPDLRHARGRPRLGVFPLGSVQDPQIISAARDRLYRVKNATNLLRKYQKYTRLVFRYRQSEFPNRYVELF